MARIVAVPGDLAQPDLGLTAPEFEQLAGQIDAIVHSGAEVNWLAPYAQLKLANVLGRRNDDPAGGTAPSPTPLRLDPRRFSGCWA
ncbi:MAG: SDR family oxidoreductase [Anaerolineales bacterium]|nr:SDR family oxidoreductase [Anaerolineales bacterium]